MGKRKSRLVRASHLEPKLTDRNISMTRTCNASSNTTIMLETLVAMNFDAIPLPNLVSTIYKAQLLQSSDSSCSDLQSSSTCDTVVRTAGKSGIQSL